MTHVLIVEDEERIASFVAKGLKQRGIKATIAHDGVEALERLQYESFDGMVLDLGLPKLDGWEVMTELDRQRSQLPIIIMTALSDEKNCDRALSLGAKAYITNAFPFRCTVKLTSATLPRSYLRSRLISIAELTAKIPLVSI